jgi:hypothetical protein
LKKFCHGFHISRLIIFMIYTDIYHNWICQSSHQFFTYQLVELIPGWLNVRKRVGLAMGLSSRQPIDGSKNKNIQTAPHIPVHPSTAYQAGCYSRGYCQTGDRPYAEALVCDPFAWGRVWYPDHPGLVGTHQLANHDDLHTRGSQKQIGHP